jgi:hypothetical protein
MFNFRLCLVRYVLVVEDLKYSLIVVSDYVIWDVLVL